MAKTADQAPRIRTRSRATAMVRLQWMIGLGLTFIIAALHLTGRLNWLEYPSLDWRARLFSKLSPPPTDRLALVAIDDQALDTVGRWPWPRAQAAQVIRELTRAGARTIVLDLLLDEPQQPRLVDDPQRPGSVLRIDDDAEFAAALRAHGNVVLGMSMPFLEERAQQAGGVERVPFNLVYARVGANLQATLEDLRDLLSESRGLDSGPAIDDLRNKIEWARRLVTRARELSIDPPGGAADPTSWPTTQSPEPPTPALFDGASMLASVSFGVPDTDGVVRRVPLWIRHADRLYPTLGLAAAAAQLGVPLERLVVTRDWTVIPTELSGSIGLRTHSARYPRMGVQQGLHYVGWPRGGGWRTQFAPIGDDARRRDGEFEIAIGRIADLESIRTRVLGNLRNVDANLRVINELFGFPSMEGSEERTAAMASLEAGSPAWQEAFAAHRAVWDAAVSEAESFLKEFQGITNLSPQETQQRDALARVAQSVPEAIRQIERGARELQSERSELRRRVNGRTVFVGWTATGSLADFVPTSIDPRTPGVHVHAAVFNAIMNRNPMLIGPLWLTLLGGLAVLVLGAVGTVLGASAGVVGGLTVLAMACGAWFIATGLAWDGPDVIGATTAPMAAGLVAWLGVIMHRLIVEQRGRKQTEARFRSYVSPEVVDILVNNPQLDTMRPARKELTILFSDIAGWTTLSERLGTEGIQAFLRTYLRAMTQELQAKKATIDKYLGDGIMAFWGAPIDNPAHARDAALAAVEMMNRLDALNAEQAFGPIGKVAVRVGLSTGEVSVGDFGNPPYKSSYTVIGDAANVAARLESANKQFGTTILMTGRTRSLIGEGVAVRLIGRLVLVGKGEPETVFELIGGRTPRGDRTKDWISVTEDAVNAYIGGRLEECEGLLSRLRDEFGDVKLASLYRESIAAVREAGGVGPGWTGAVVLTEK